MKSDKSGIRFPEPFLSADYQLTRQSRNGNTIAARRAGVAIWESSTFYRSQKGHMKYENSLH